MFQLLDVMNIAYVKVQISVSSLLRKTNTDHQNFYEIYSTVLSMLVRTLSTAVKTVMELL
jgi:hypothetical protein